MDKQTLPVNERHPPNKIVHNQEKQSEQVSHTKRKPQRAAPCARQHQQQHSADYRHNRYENLHKPRGKERVSHWSNDHLLHPIERTMHMPFRAFSTTSLASDSASSSVWMVSAGRLPDMMKIKRSGK